MNEEIKERLEQIRRGELPDGYRRTKAGIIPNNWEITRLRDSGRKCLKKNADFKIRLVFSNSAQNGIIPQEEQFDKSIANKEHIDGYYIVKPGDFVYNPRISATAPCGPINRNETEETGIISPLYTVFTVDSPKADNAYLKHYFKSSHWFQYMKGVANYGVRHDRMNISDADFFAMPFPTPPLAEQKRIADILSAQDSVIGLKERLLTEKQRQKKYLMQRLFAEFHGEKRKINDICEILGGGTPDTRKTEYWNGEILWCTPSDFSKSGTKYIDGTEKRISQLGLKSSSATMLPVGAVLLCTRATVGEARIASRPICTNQGFQSMIANPGISNEWLYYLAQYIKSDIIKLASGSTFLEISKSALSNIIISVPALEFQLKIADVLSAADREIELLRASLEQEKRKKKALSQLLLTGIVRV